MRAGLTLDGLRGTQSAAFTRPATDWVWQVSAPPMPAKEDVVDLTMTFYAAQDAVRRFVKATTKRHPTSESPSAS